jgi:hypothetical protein
MEHPSTSAAFPQEKEEIFRAQRATERPQTGKNPSRDRCPFFCSHGTNEDGCKVYGPYSCIEDPCYSPTEPKYEERSPSSTPSLICSESTISDRIIKPGSSIDWSKYPSITVSYYLEKDEDLSDCDSISHLHEKLLQEQKAQRGHRTYISTNRTPSTSMAGPIVLSKSPYSSSVSRSPSPIRSQSSTSDRGSGSSTL